ncbi:hypothetical protein HKW90_02955 [Pseudomonas aeruginosa]|uniref:hypothetical protein n=1 Tax=Pseudomonas aeruginosa TaxID=287 RepID=UPI00163ADAA1|nr:hypothetical protein [Pseudomonas aeruginosa]MBF3053363.1 hypothetical protein [Pseudomonas aeruginosa]
MSNELTDVRCPCGAEFQADSYDAGFIAGSGMCQNCDAALPPKDICTCPSGDGSLSHPCPAHPAVEQAGANVGHGHVFPRADGVKMRCGGPGLCSECAADAYRARAALAQPSPTTDSRPAEWSSYDPTWVVDFIRDNSIFNADLIERMLEYATRPAGDVPQAEQAEAERPEGPTEDELEAAGLGYPLHKEEAVKLWYSGFRSEVITVLEAWEAIGHDIGMNPDKGELLDSLRYMLEKCEAHDAALAEVAGLRSLLNSLLCYVERDIDRMRSDRDKSDNKEIYDRSISLAMERLKAAQNAVFTTEPGCDTAVELAAQTTQAQHCVPELLVRAEDFVSGKEVPQAWLDVQAERRRQITAEGWTPDHDDLYCAAELPRAAAAYILSGANDEAPAIWPFSAKWWKPRDARANYMRAGALILAEIERLDRAAAAGKEVGHE